ncbi:hypothetical protein, partial [Pseudomonas aeruginosa]|uniref:hypothetical protein n=1 Tax=Pseudomonas aeruginosa TaxID=287 RepID=UPI00307E9FE8
NRDLVSLSLSSQIREGTPIPEIQERPQLVGNSNSEMQLFKLPYFLETQVRIVRNTTTISIFLHFIFLYTALQQKQFQ